MDNKIEVVANDTADRVVALSDTWNAEEQLHLQMGRYSQCP
jgi:hypothetical protein